MLGKQKGRKKKNENPFSAELVLKHKRKGLERLLQQQLPNNEPIYVTAELPASNDTRKVGYSVASQVSKDDFTRSNLFLSHQLN